MLLSLRFVVQINRKGFMNESRKMENKNWQRKLESEELKKQKLKK